MFEQATANTIRCPKISKRDMMTLASARCSFVEEIFIKFLYKKLYHIIDTLSLYILSENIQCFIKETANREHQEIIFIKLTSLCT